MKTISPNISFVLSTVAAPLFLGGMIYILFRSESLTLFSWIGDVGLAKEVGMIRHAAFPLKQFIPKWIIYSLPNALWAFSMECFFAITWSPYKRIYLGVTTLVIITPFWIEYLQFLRVLPGTFCIEDVILLAFASAIFFLLHLNRSF